MLLRLQNWNKLKMIRETLYKFGLNVALTNKVQKNFQFRSILLVITI